MKRSRKIGVTVCVLALLGGVGYGGYRVYQNHFGGAVSVFAIDDNISTTQNWNDSNEYDGTVQTDGMQQIMISDSQEVSDVRVKKGDKVKRGDTLFTYDSTLSDIDLRRKNLNIQQLQLQLTEVKRKLRIIQSYRAGVPIKDPVTIDAEVPDTHSSDDTNATETKAQAPSYQVVSLNAPTGGNNSNGGNGGTNNGGTNNGTDGNGTDGNGGADGDTPVDPSMVTFTREQLDHMIKAGQDSVRDLDLQLRQSELEYTKLKREQTKNSVTSEINGTVTYVGDKNDKEKCFMKISAGGTYVIQISVNEFTLGNVKKGQKAQIQDWMTGDNYTGTVESVEKYPSGDGYSGNTNSSYYPVKIAIDDKNVTLSQDTSVSVTLQSAEEDANTFYLQSCFILTEGNQRYVYVRGENDLLEKRRVRTGKNMDGAYLQILSGVTQEDFVAFPYGKNVKEGALTEQGDISQLYEDF